MVNGAEVYYDDEKSHTATHLSDTPQLLSLVKNFLSKQTFHENKLFIEHNAEKIIGHTDLVDTHG